MHLRQLRISSAAFLFVFTAAIAFAQSADFRSVRPQARVTRVADDAVTVTLRGNVHPLARAEFDLGPAPATTPMDRMILLLQADPVQEAALAGLLAAQQDPRSPEYQHWLTPEDFGRLFGIADKDQAQLISWLNSHGFAVEPLPASRLQIVFSGTAQ